MKRLKILSVLLGLILIPSIALGFGPYGFNPKNITVDMTFKDDIALIFGTSSDFHWEYDSANGWLQLSDGTNDFLRVTDAGTGGTFAFLGDVSIQSVTDSTTGVQILDADGGTPILNVDTTNERVGIGTASPSYIVDISGANWMTARIVTTNASTGAGLFLESPNQTWQVQARDSDDIFVIRDENAGTQTRFAINNSGYIGIGDTSPDDLVDITGGALRIQAQADDFAIVNTTSLGILKFFGDDDTASADEIGGQIEVVSDATWTDGAESAYMALSTIVSGTLTEGLRIDSTKVSTTRYLSGGTPSISKSAAYTIGTTDAQEAYGYITYVTAAAVITLPAVADGMSGCVYSTTAAAVSVDTNPSDKFVLFNGAALDDGDKVTSASGAGDYICWAYYSADGWATWGRSGVWTDDGA